VTGDLCSEVQSRLAASGLHAFDRDELARFHLFECEHCYAALQASIERGREAVAAREDEAARATDAARFFRRLRPRAGRVGPLLIGIAAIAIAVVGAYAIFLPLHRQSPHATPNLAEEIPEWLQHMDREEGGKGRRHRDEDGSMGSRVDPKMAREEAKQPSERAGTSHFEPNALERALMGDRAGDKLGFNGLGLRGTGRGGGGSGEGTIGLGALSTIGHGATVAALDGIKTKKERADTDDQRAALAKASSSPDSAQSKPGQPRRSIKPSKLPRFTRYAATAAPAKPAPGVQSAADALLARYSAIDGVPFIDPNGYFANTYVPGDPALRALQARLSSYDRSALLPASVQGARFDAAAERNAQPFDAPSHAALAVYLSASERGLTGPRRMLVQVGLQATPRYSGRRPAMNIGIVLDLREALDAGQSQSVSALLAAFADAHDLGDKLALFAAGPGGGLVVDADAFRHGPLTVALQNLLARRDVPGVSLHDAVQRALTRVRGSDDPNAPLGSSVVIVVAPHALGQELAELETLAHESAVAGVPVSAFGVGALADPNELSRLALAGQGNRRMLASGADAAPAVEHELSAVARAVARAVRLRIRLAAGVHLVSVLGSHPLDAVQVERVHEAENGIDQRLSKNLGIQSDRGDDEEGVQIVVPSFYAGDSHVLLLDVVADGPGLVADVTARFKDLVQLGNGIARQSLWLPNLELARGALERNVLKNLVAFELAQKLGAAGDALASGSPESARAVLNDALALLDSLGGALPELIGDHELGRDRALTAEYATALADATRDPQRAFFVDSLHFASLLKLQPRPEWDARTE
jgi:hypothetical protein